MPFPKKPTLLQYVGIGLMIIATALSILFKDSTVRFAIYAFFSVGIVLALNESLNKASLSLHLDEISVKLTGSIVFAALIIYWDPIGKFHNENKTLKTITVLVHGKAGMDDLIMKGHGSVIIHINGADSPEPIDYRGSAKFSNLRVGDTFRLTVMDSERFMVRKPDSVYTVGDQNEIPLEVYLKGIDRIFGYVRYQERPVAGVRVSFDMIDSLTDSIGRFVLNIPDSLQRQNYLVNVDKKGFKSKTASAYPESEQPLSIILEKR